MVDRDLFDFLERTADAAFAVTDGGEICSWNSSAEALFGFGREEAGNKGFMEAIAGPFTIDWSSEDLERVTRTVIKRHNAEIHAQTAIDAALELKRQHRFVAARCRSD